MSGPRALALALALFAASAGAAPAEPKPLPEGGLTIQELQQWLQARDYRAAIKATDSGREYILSSAKGLHINVEPYDCNAGRCASLQFRVYLDEDIPFELAKTNEWNDKKRWATAFIDKDGDAVLQMDVSLSPGVTDAALADHFDIWLSVLGEFKTFMGW